MSTAIVSPGQPAGALARSAVVRPLAYERISRFRVNRDGVDAEVVRNIKRQGMDNDAAAEAMWGVTIPDEDHYTDDDRSASQYATKVREQWLELLARIRRGEATHVLVWLFDRAFRTTEAAEELLEACRIGGARIVQTAGSPVTVDPHNPDDIFRMKLAGLLAEYEVAKMAMRQRRAKLAAAEAGKPHGGRRRFGFEPGNAVVRESEARYVRELATRFLAGESLYKLAQWLNTPGPIGPDGRGSVAVLGASGGTWTGPNLRHLLKAPHLAGIRVHKGTQYPGDWEAIIPVETHHTLEAKLSDPTRRTNGTGTNARKYLLAGLMVCDACGLPMRGHPARKQLGPAYTCPTGRHVHRPVELVDNLVEWAIVERLTIFDPRSGILVDDEATAELSRLTAARAAMDEEYADAEAARAAGELTLRAYAAETSRLETAMADTDRAIKAAAAEVGEASRVLAGAMGEAAELAWFGDGTEAHPGWSLARKRAIIAELCEVRLRGGRRGTHSWDPDRDVVLNWR